MSGLDVKVILLFAMLGTALAFRTSNEDEGDSLSADVTEIEDGELELHASIQQDKAELMETYAKIAKEHAEVYCTQCLYIAWHALDLFS